MNPFIISLAIKLTILLMAGGLAAILVRRSTYAMRHVVIAATLLCVVALPATMLAVPEWRVGVLPAASPVSRTFTIVAIPLRAAVGSATETKITAAAPSASESMHPVLITSLDESSVAAAPVVASRPSLAASMLASLRTITPSQLLLAIWLAGVVLGLAWIAVGRFGLARVRRRATPLATYEWRTILETEAMHAGVARRVALFTSPSVSGPVTWGVLSPVIVLPEASLAWTHERKRVVVMHEMAHIARRDSATQLLATFACVAYWLHPMVLLAARRLRAECERACDERVLARGTPASEYAAHLLDVARYSRSFGAASIVSVAMARPSQLEGRLLAVLRAKPRRSQLSHRARVLGSVAAVALLMAISAFRPVERAVKTSETHLVLAAVTLSRSTSATLDTGEWTPAIPVAPKAPRAPRVSPVTPPAPIAPTSTTSPTAPIAPIAPVALSHDAIRLRTKPDTMFEKSVPAHDGGTLDIDLDTGGEIHITGTDDAKVTVNTSLAGTSWQSTTVELSEHDGEVRLESRYEPTSGPQQFDNTFTIMVPKHFNVRLSSAGGSVTISDVEGRFSGTTGGGSIAIDHAKGTASLATGGGDLRLTDSHLDGSVATGGGVIKFSNVTGSIMPVSASGGYRYSYGGKRKSYSSGKSRSPDESYSTPDDSQNFFVPEMDTASIRIARITMEATKQAMKRVQAEMKRSQASMQRIRIRTFDDSGTAAFDSAWERNREAMDRSRDNMDRSRDEMDRMREEMNAKRGAMDSARIIIKRQHIVIDKDGGSIKLLNAPHGAHLATGGGSIVVGHASGVVSALTGAGSISISSADGAAKATTGAGDVSINLVGEDPHPVDVRSGSGSVELVIPKGANATLDLETAYTKSYGKKTSIKGDWPLTSTETDDWDTSDGSPRKYVRVRQMIGNGGPVIHVRTVNGDIRIKQGS